MAVEKDSPSTSVPLEREGAFEEANIKITGTIDDLYDKVDIMVDCTPGGIGAKNKEIYAEKGVKGVFQGGEKHEQIGKSFNSFANYTDNWGADFVRVVSCNTTGLCRTLKPIDDLCGVKKVRAVMVRRGADPGQIKSDP
jgi:glyceraldehyde-3-phosphate dehydrogenase (NAD(P))